MSTSADATLAPQCGHDPSVEASAVIVECYRCAYLVEPAT
jgi:hypothetical protein